MTDEGVSVRVSDPIRQPINIVPKVGNDMSDGMSMYEILSKAQAVTEGIAASKQRTNLGKKFWPFDYSAVKKFRDANVFHSRCIETKKNAIVGLGFKAEGEGKDKGKVDPLTGMPEQKDPMEALDEVSKVNEILDPLCDNSFDDVLSDVCEDAVEVGVGYMEVVREAAGGRPVGIHHCPGDTVSVYVENHLHEFHYEVQPVGGSLVRFPKFGDYEAFKSRRSTDTQIQSGEGEQRDTYSEIIPFRFPTNRSKWYGFPDWLAAVAHVELEHMMLQFLFDYFNNRGIPDFIYQVTGGTVNAKDWEAIQLQMKGTIGRGNQHKSMAVNFPGELKGEVLNLGGDGQHEGEMFSLIGAQTSIAIVSAHGVPPLLAGIQIPGKMGATNELPNALMAFQTLEVEQRQRLFCRVLGNTLGNPELNGGLGLKKEDFKLRRITDLIDIGKADTVSRMRQTVPEAKAEGRDLKEGLKKALETADDNVIAAMTAKVVEHVIDRLIGARAA